MLSLQSQCDLCSDDAVNVCMYKTTFEDCPCELCLTLPCELCTDDAINVGMYKTFFEDYAHDEFESDGNSNGHIGNLDEATHEASKWLEELCGAQKARPRHRYDAKPPEMVRTGREFVRGFFSEATTTGF